MTEIKASDRPAYRRLVLRAFEEISEIENAPPCSSKAARETRKAHRHHEEPVC